WSFEYGYSHVRDVRIGASEKNKAGRITVTQLDVAGEPVEPTPRFWKSFFSRFGVTDNVFRYFTPEEVFERISLCNQNDRFRYCIERRDDGTARLLAVSNPKRPIIGHDDVERLVDRY